MKRIRIIEIMTVLCISSLVISGCGNTSQSESSAQNEEAKSQITDGWNDINGSKYYYEDGEKKTGWLKLENNWYYLGDDGKQRIGWIKDENENWHYMNDDGTMATNTTVDGKYLNKEGLIEETPANNDKKSSDSNFNESNNNVEKSNIVYEIYKNSRYGFSISYPSNYKAGRAPDNGDGINLYCDDGGEINVSGMNNVFNYSTSDCYNEALSRINNTISYKTCDKNKFVISYEENGLIYYRCTVVGAGSENTFIIKYPVSRKDYYDEVVNTLYNSFNTPGIGEPH